MIRDAKFPRKTAIIPYSQSKRLLCDFLATNSGNLDALDHDIVSLETKWRREPDGWMKAEYRRNIDAIDAFKAAFKKARAKKYTFVKGPTDVAMRLEGVLLNVRMDVALTETNEAGVTYSGGCVVFIAATAPARKKIEDRTKSTAALVHWSLQNSSSNIEVLDRLCMTFDLFGLTMTKAPKSFDRLRANMTTACREAASSWDRVEPPNGYDGPDWQ